MAIIFPNEVQAPDTNRPVSLDISQVGGLGMLDSVMDLNTNKRILISDGSNNRILIGYIA